ncbi:MAG: SIS domain-containing protein [Erysipelotrichaceae bacterium]|nr:SIS domain-containing protein [Erysipelotrichaceae bacterium]MDY5251585.1 SIS domain-containing protein [Erysipelotrichaceae bacterium]
MSLLDCIVNIPTYLKDIVENSNRIKINLSNYLKNETVDEIVFIASGTSLNASKVTRYFAKNNCSLNVQCFYPNEFLNYIDYKNPNALYVLVSQGGSTKLVYDALQKVKKANLKHCTITESLDSPIAKASDLAIEMGSVNEPYMYRTIGYSTTVTTCWMLELSIAVIQNKISEVMADKLKKELLSAINNLANIRELTEAWYENNKFSLLRRSKAILAGAQCFYETANEADIKLMEMVPMFTRSFELEELIHGPQNAFDDDTLFFILSENRFDKDKAIHIAQFLKTEIGFCALVGDNKLDDRDLVYEFASENFRAIEEVTPFQVIAYHMATDKGRDLKRGVNTSIQKYIKKTL